MKTKDIIARESLNSHKIVLYPQSKFYTAYNLSAFLVVTQFWPDLKVLLKQIHQVGRFVRVGFPQDSFQEKILLHAQKLSLPITYLTQAEVFPPETQTKPHDSKAKSTDKVALPHEKPSNVPIVEIGPFVVDQAAYQNWLQAKLASIDLLKQRMQPFYGSRPVYRKFQLFSIEAVALLQKLPHDLHDILGRTMMDTLIKCDRLLYDANVFEKNPTKCLPILRAIDSNLEVISYLLRLTVERATNIGIDRFHNLLDAYAQCHEQLHKWIKSLPVESGHAS
ncbi:hypothetical protein IJJ12_00450 [bacterium]|nr:hypothetical protein [bacterium]